MASGSGRTHCRPAFSPRIFADWKTGIRRRGGARIEPNLLQRPGNIPVRSGADAPFRLPLEGGGAALHQATQENPADNLVHGGHPDRNAAGR